MEVLTPMTGEKFIFPIADGTVKLSGGDQVLRTSTLIRDRSDRGEEQGDLQGESDGSSSTPLRDSAWYDGEARNDFWSISGNFVYRHLVEPRVKLYVPTEESFSIPVKYIDVTRTTDTSLDVMSEKHIDDFWNLEGDRELSDTTRWIYMLREGTDEKATDLQARHFVARDLERYVRCIETQRKAKVGYRETKARQCQKIAWYLLH